MYQRPDEELHTFGAFVKHMAGKVITESDIDEPDINGNATWTYKKSHAGEKTFDIYFVPKQAVEFVALDVR